MRSSPRWVTIVFSPNPRGSYGQGERFTLANVKDFGYGDLRDILKGMDTLEARLPHRQKSRRPHRLELRRLHDHVRRHPEPTASRPPSPVPASAIGKSYYGENSIDQWMLPFFGKTVYDDPAGLRQELRHRVHQERQDADPGHRRRPRWRVPRPAELRVLARPSAPKASRRSSSSIPTKATDSAIPNTSATATSAS